jgi:hypothetical protein
MYAMDTAVHFEHRTETRRQRTELRRAAQATGPQGLAIATTSEPELRAADDFTD